MKTNITTLGNVLSILVVLCTQLLEKKNADNVISSPLLNIGYECFAQQIQDIREQHQYNNHISFE